MAENNKDSSINQDSKQQDESGVMNRRIMVLGLSLTLIIAVVFTIVSLVNLSRTTEQNIRTTAELTMHRLTLSIKDTFTPAIDLLNSAAVIISLIDDFDELHRITHEMAKTVENVHEIFYGTIESRFAGGQFLASTYFDYYGSNPEWDQWIRPWFIAGIENPGTLQIINPYVDTQTWRTAVAMSRTIHALDGRIKGVGGTNIFLDDLIEIVSNQRVTSDGKTFIVNDEGLYLIHEDISLVLNENFFEVEGKELDRDFLSGLQVRIIGRNYWAAIPVSDTNWYVVSMGSTAELDSVFTRVLMITIISSAAMAFIAIFISQRMLRQISTLKERTEAKLYAEITRERDIIQTMQDNIHQGVFLMDQEYKILPEYSKPLVTILSYYGEELAGKNFLDILASSLDTRQLQTMKAYYSMIFAKSKSVKVLEAANPISEFEYKIDDRTKILSSRFGLIEKADSEPLIIGMLQDVTREKEFDTELKAQKEAKEREMNDMFEVIQLDPVVFQDFIEDTEANFNYLNTILKDKNQTEKQVVTKFYQIIHATKANAQILGFDSYAKKLHAFEDDIKTVSAGAEIGKDEVLALTVRLESIMQEKDTYIKMFKKIDTFRATNRLDSILHHGLNRAVEKLAKETKKKVELKKEQLDLDILGSKLRKPIKDILFQCVRNSIYHGIETVDERIKLNKRPGGLLTFGIRNVNGKAEISFSDDGHGLDWDKIKARHLELHPDAQDTSKKVLLASIFSPEFSTSDEVSMAAGRGVGLSLVRDIVKENGGAISVNSSDHGLSLKFTFPLPKN
ncbi:MAG: ATP-binding protein [Treponema sp.]|nr:ATP-binding protein [Treponema sp.]